MSTVSSAIRHIGLTPLANRLGFRPSAIFKWQDSNRLPQSELAGTTNYAEVIEEMTEGKYTAEQLIAATREMWRATPPRKRGGSGKRKNRKRVTRTHNEV